MFCYPVRFKLFHFSTWIKFLWSRVKVLKSRLLEFRFPIELTKHLISERFIIQKSILENKNSDVGFKFFFDSIVIKYFPQRSRLGQVLGVDAFLEQK